jgi:hypothetical protein
MELAVSWRQASGHRDADPFQLPVEFPGDEASIRSELGLGPFVPLSIKKTALCVEVVVGREPAPTLPTSIVNRLSFAENELRSLRLEIAQLKDLSKAVSKTKVPAVASAVPQRSPLAPKSTAVSHISPSPPFFGMIPDVPLLRYASGKSQQLSALVAGKMAILGGSFCLALCHR